MAPPTRAEDAVTALDDLRLDSDRRLTIQGLLLLLAPAIWFITSDFALYGGDAAKLRQRLLWRLVLIVVPLIGVAVMRSVKTRAEYSRAVLALSLLIAFVTITINSIRPAGSGLPMRSPLVVVGIMYFAMPDTLIRQCIAPIGLSLGLIGLRMTFLGGGGVDVAGDVLALAAMNGLGILTIMRRTHLDTATSVVVGELKTLRGIIPICSHCRKLRSEVGDWQQIERYFHERSEAAFSHGICPDCLREHYHDTVSTR